MPSCAKKDVMCLVDQAESEGWTVTKAGSGHLKLRSPSGATVIVACTPTSGRAFYNTRALLWKAGLSKPPKPGTPKTEE